MYLIQILLPLHDNEHKKFPLGYYDSVRQTLTRRFGGVTAFVRSPAVGLWKESDADVSCDDVVMFEVIAPELDKTWWAKYRSELEEKFRQEEILIWASSITRL